MSFTVSSAGIAAKQFTLTAGATIKIGRSPTAEFKIEHRGCSQNHAEFTVVASDNGGAPRLCVRDTSSNGTGLRRPGVEHIARIGKDTDEPIETGMVVVMPMRIKDDQGRLEIDVSFGEAGKADKSGKRARHSEDGKRRAASPSPEDSAEARKLFVELLLKTREITGSSTYEDAQKVLQHDPAWKACALKVRKECFTIFVEHLSGTAVKKKKKKDKDDDRDGRKREKESDKGRDKDRKRRRSPSR